MRAIRVLTAVMALAFGQFLWAEASPIPMLENTANQIIATLKENKASLKSNPRIIQQAVQRYLLPNVDVNGMARSVLGRQAWNKASVSERQEFSEAFTQLVIRTYASPLSEYTDESIKFLPVRGSLDGRFLRVNSVIVRSKGKNIPLSYSLVSKNGSWKIYDFSVEGVSLLQSFRSQFAEALRSSSMQDIIKQLHQQSGKKAA
ncbi:MlaC/ttg2D family ABC transporter substrate-binding protein [Legionella jordanis]|uniref:Toluene tolerance protein Ttg2D n=1 Tax=Legionella jordanis TaxID=456 RepID=A0A0W0V8A9_9GAMM|nr:ABC transporter substrate-binding protein [Legionella jordanis]KTD16330.1 toluene tolerance protein Ttg2D [Legionella jordanis]RMX04457.1 ABC transporter substrate-binding protein [Legionella jordanis]RMX21002.1 ABC transporter substrate-binding protein [Legionella jordanis]VEH12212.1 signal peptide protein, toluene tolerance protein Ttg2D [Legionella jordanis]HAT8713422.1 ABC transporter substrate-binding protein [Legionella jordanis]